MVMHLLEQCCLVQRILEAWEAIDHTQAAGGRRCGNMGHLMQIANAVAQSLERSLYRATSMRASLGLPRALGELHGEDADGDEPRNMVDT